MHAAEHYHTVGQLLRYLRQRQRVADEVGHILDFAPLIVVAEHHGILLLFQTLYLFFQIGSCCYGLVDKPVINILYLVIRLNFL